MKKMKKTNKKQKNEVFFIGYLNSNGEICEKKITARTENDAMDELYSMASKLDMNSDSVVVYVDKK